MKPKYGSILRIFRILALPSFFIFSLFVGGCSSMETLTSKWSKDEVKVDGIGNEWQNSLTYYEDQKAMIGVRNDKDYMYVCFKTSDPSNIRKAMQFGLTFWVNNSADKSKSFGVHYPIGMTSDKLKMEESNQSADNDQKNSVTAREKGKQMSERMTTMLKELELESKDGQDSRIMYLDDALGKFNIQAALKNDDEILTIELAIPLHSKMAEFSVNPLEGKTLGLGLETGEFKKPEGGPKQKEMGEGGGYPGGGGMMPPSGGGYPGGGYPGGGGGMPGGMGMGGRHGRGGGRGMNSESSGNMRDQLKMWFEVQLAKQ
jgi:hypothetical protein